MVSPELDASIPPLYKTALPHAPALGVPVRTLPPTPPHPKPRQLRPLECKWKRRMGEEGMEERKERESLLLLPGCIKSLLSLALCEGIGSDVQHF